MATTTSPAHFMATSGETDPVWVHTEPYDRRPKFARLDKNIEADVCVIGSGISGIQSAYELVKRGRSVVMLEARDILSGESDRTSGHLASALDDGYTNIAKLHGDSGAAIAAESHVWAVNRVGEIAKELGIECEYRLLPGYQISQYDRRKQSKEHDDDVKELKAEVVKAQALKLRADFQEGYAIQGWDGEPDQRDAAVFHNQGTFHPTKYLLGVLKWLAEQPNFSCYTHSRVMDVSEPGLSIPGIVDKKRSVVKTDDGYTVSTSDTIMATCVPLQKLSIVAEMEYHRTYCIAIKIPKGTVEDCLIYDTEEAYKYIRMTECDAEHEYMIVGGCDHAVGQEKTDGRFEELATWTRERFTKASSVDYAWSGQIFDPVDYMAFIGLDPGRKHTYIVTGDSGNGLTHGVIAGRLLADEIEGKENKWAKLQYKRFLQSDIQDIEDLANGEGGVLNTATNKPTAVYKDDAGNVHKFSALCPHLKGVVCWNKLEKSWDCPVHGSRFSKDGICVMGPSKANLGPMNESGEALQNEATKS